LALGNHCAIVFIEDPHEAMLAARATLLVPRVGRLVRHYREYTPETETAHLLECPEFPDEGKRKLQELFSQSAVIVRYVGSSTPLPIAQPEESVRESCGLW